MENWTVLDIKDTFIDIETGRSFDGHIPYIFKYENGQSTGLNYVKKICLASQKANLTFKVESDQDIFRILKLDQNIPNLTLYPRIDINMHSYLDMNDPENNLLADEWNVPGVEYITEYEPLEPGDTPPGTPKKGIYIYILYFLARAENPGEYICKFSIQENETDPETGENIWSDYLLMADFYAENEVLKERLQTLESRLPESIQKAVYDENVHEEFVDNILINRKNKELLMQYMNIVANKGSYESLIQSLEWFEWGKLLRLEELWKRYGWNINDVDYLARELNSKLSEKDVQQLKSQVKSTYIGLYCALEDIRRSAEGEVVYQDSLGRQNIQSGVSWQDRDGSHMMALSDMYNNNSNNPEVMPATAKALAMPIEIPGMDSSDIWLMQVDMDDLELREVDGEFKIFYHNAPGVFICIFSSSWVELTPNNFSDYQTHHDDPSYKFYYIYEFDPDNPQALPAELSNDTISEHFPGTSEIIPTTSFGNLITENGKILYNNQEGYFWIYNSETKQWQELTAGNLSTNKDLANTYSETYTIYQIYPNYVYNEPMPSLVRIASIWTGQDISLKLSTLGSFYKTFFMPIHLDLIHACMEYWATSYGLKLLYSQQSQPRAWMANVRSFDLEYKSDWKLVPDIDIYSYYNTPFRKIPDPNINNQDMTFTGDVFGFIEKDEYESVYDIDGDGTISFWNNLITGDLAYFYKGVCCKVECEGLLENVHMDSCIYRQRLTWYRKEDKKQSSIDTYAIIDQINGNVKNYIRDSIPQYDYGRYVKEGNSGEASDFIPLDVENIPQYKKAGVPTYNYQHVIPLKFKLGFKESGSYDIYLEFWGTGGEIWQKNIKLKIEDGMSDRIEIKRLVPRKDLEWSDSSLKSQVDLFQYANNDQQIPTNIQSGFFTADPNSRSDKAGLNHTLAIIIENNYTFDNDFGRAMWWDGENRVNPVEDSLILSDFEETLNTIVAKLEEVFDNYWWFWDKIWISYQDTLDLREDYYRILGICKNTTREDTTKVELKNFAEIDGCLRFIDEDRFYPIFHQLEDVNIEQGVDPTELLCIIPQFKHGYKISDATWTFINRSTGESFTTGLLKRSIRPDGHYNGVHDTRLSRGGTGDVMIMNTKPEKLTPGYYDVILKYRMRYSNNEEIIREYKSVFWIKKS